MHGELRRVIGPADIQNPLLQHLFAYWDTARGERFAPARRDIGPHGMAGALPFVALVDVLEDGQEFRFRLAGTRIVNGFGMDLTGRRLSELARSRVRDLLASQYRAVAADGQPVVSGPAGDGSADRKVYVNEALALPLSSDGAEVDMILAGIVATPQSRIGPLAL